MWYYLAKEALHGSSRMVKLYPHAPKNIDQATGDIPRIAVYPTVYQCLRAMFGENIDANKALEVFNGKNPPVYMTEVVPYIPPYCTTEERWLIEPATFMFVGYVNLLQFFTCGSVFATVKEEIENPDVFHGLSITPSIDVTEHMVEMVIRELEACQYHSHC